MRRACSSRYLRGRGRVDHFYFGTEREVTLSRIVRNRHHECIEASLALNKGGTRAMREHKAASSEGTD